jgi:hypothetical protein
LGVLELTALPSIKEEHWIPEVPGKRRKMGRRDTSACNPVLSRLIRVLSVIKAAERDGAFMEPSGRDRW